MVQPKPGITTLTKGLAKFDFITNPTLENKLISPITSLANEASTEVSKNNDQR